MMDERSVLARVERVTLRELRLWVREGWVRPAQGEAGPMFDELDVARVRLLCDLRKEMALPSDALPTVLTLVDHLHRARRDLRRLIEALDGLPHDARETILSRLREARGQGTVE